jgi:hypothetical protein
MSQSLMRLSRNCDAAKKSATCPSVNPKSQKKMSVFNEKHAAKTIGDGREALVQSHQPAHVRLALCQ